MNPQRLLCTLLLAIGLTPQGKAQLCTGSLGDPVVNITFGSGPNPGPPLAAASTSYSYSAEGCPDDGNYAIRNSSYNCFENTWQNLITDHTGNVNGYFMLVNASYQPSDFYVQAVDNLCGGTTYQFAAWIANILVSGACGNNGIRPNITFKIETRSGTVLQSYNTGDIPTGTNWKQFGFFFTTPSDASSVIVRMTNNAPGGCGNDLALDDITFRPCGPLVTTAISGNNGASDSHLCEDDPTTLQFQTNVSAGYGSPAFQWQLSTDQGVSWKDITGATTVGYTRQPTPPGIYQYRLTVAEGANITLTNCRISSNILTVTVNPRPIIQITTNSPVCEGGPLNFSATGGDQYDWTGPGSFTATGQTVTIPGAATGNSGMYSLHVTTAEGCSRTASATAQVYANPLARFALPTPACEKSPLLFSDQSSASGQDLVQWNWDFGDGTQSSAKDPSHSFLAAGDYAVSLVVTTDKGCSSVSQTSLVSVNNLPHPDFGLPEICLADPYAFFTDSTTIAGNNPANLSWSWDFGDPLASPANPNSSTQPNPRHKYSAAGPYAVKLTVTSDKGCASDTTRKFTVNGSFPMAGFTVENNATLCSNQPITVTNHSSVTPGNIVRVEIYWNYGEDPSIKTTDEAPYPGKQYAYQYPEFSSPATRSFQIRYVAYSGINCVNESAATITVNASPLARFDPPASLCEEAFPVTITQGHEAYGFQGTGVYSGRGISIGGVFNPGAAGPGRDSLYYTFMAANGCSSRAGQEIQVYPQPAADAGPDLYALEGEPVTLEGSGTGNAVQFLWTPDSAIDNPRIARPRVSPSNDLTYTLQVISADGCTRNDQALVTVLKLPVVPNAFSPNGDGVNDTWMIRYLESYPSAEVQVFNRYGQPVFHSIGHYTPWDGTYKGQPLPVATYYWIIRPNYGRKQIAGSVTILR